MLNEVDPFTAASLGAQINVSKAPQPNVDGLLSDRFEPWIARVLISSARAIPRHTSGREVFRSIVCASTPGRRIEARL